MGDSSCIDQYINMSLSSLAPDLKHPHFLNTFNEPPQANLKTENKTHLLFQQRPKFPIPNIAHQNSMFPTLSFF